MGMLCQNMGSWGHVGGWGGKKVGKKINRNYKKKRIFDIFTPTTILNHVTWVHIVQ